MFFSPSYKVGRAYQFSRQYELCQTKCSLLEQHPVKVLFRSIIVSSFICSIFIAMHNTSNRNYPNYLPFALLCCACVSVSAYVSVRLFGVTILSISAPEFTCQVSWVVKSLLMLSIFHLLVIHNNFLDVEIIALELAAISKKTTGNKHQIMMKRACN